MHRTTAKCNPMSIGNTLCKDEIINEWNVRLNEIKDNVSRIREMIDIYDHGDRHKQVNYFSFDDISHIYNHDNLIFRY